MCIKENIFQRNLSDDFLDVCYARKKYFAHTTTDPKGCIFAVYL